jgi:hypothetical protein
MANNRKATGVARRVVSPVDQLIGQFDLLRLFSAWLLTSLGRSVEIPLL